MEDTFYLHIHYGGNFEHVVDILKEYGYNVGCKLWYLIPGMSMHDGLRSLSCDGHAMDLAAYGLSSDANVVKLFVEKNVSMSTQVGINLDAIICSALVNEREETSGVEQQGINHGTVGELSIIAEQECNVPKQGASSGVNKLRRIKIRVGANDISRRKLHITSQKKK
ncbi:hypothetical protein SESBI_07921 [Sesbania bispinosa]|nr:hypothetical protein SESBI_07921 [Sesbania bispinosa]